ncbi:hypothetical protein [Actinoallomurus vinaceus]|uniref:hypothetical protein n=1 Tax=Actinoallomurus vinaceus TaxID=1080074 RepID=UPI0031EF0630
MLEAEGFPIADVSDNIEDPTVSVWFDLCRPTAEAIAHRLEVSLPTVQRRLANLKKRLAVHTRIAIVVAAMRRGWIQYRSAPSARAPRDRHGRPLRLIYGFVCVDRPAGEPDPADLAAPDAVATLWKDEILRGADQAENGGPVRLTP